MNQIQLFFSKTNIIFSHKPFVLFLFTGLILVKIGLVYLANRNGKYKQNKTIFLLFSIPIITYIISEITVIVSLFDLNNTTRMFLRMAWHMQPLHFFTQALFLIVITRQKHQMVKIEKTILQLLFIFIFLPLLLLIKIPTNLHWLFNILLKVFCRVTLLKSIIIKSSGIILLFAYILHSLKKILHSRWIANILRLQVIQLLILLFISLIPETILLCAATLPSLALFNDNIILNLLSSTSFTSFLIFVSRKLYQLRFLNLMQHVETKPITLLTDSDFLTIKEALSETKKHSDLSYIHELFFQKLASITPERIVWTLRIAKKPYENDSTEYRIEEYIQEKSEFLKKFFAKDAIFVYDELTFTNFYEQSDDITDIISFMDSIDAAMFIPLIHSNQIFGSIVIKKSKNKKELFPRAIQTQIQLYATYITYTLIRFKQEQDETVHQEYKKALLDLHQTNQKNLRLQESITKLLKPETTTHCGILFYKNSIFTPINAVTELLLQIDPNKHHHHPLTKSLKELIRRITQYRTPHTIIEKNSAGNDIYCQGYLTEDKDIIILLSFANLTNMLPIEQTFLHNENLDYIIFLYGSEIGTIVNQALPGNGTLMVQAKIELIKTLLTKKTMLLDVNYNDRETILTLAQKICHKTTVYTVDIAQNPNHDAVCTKLFGKQRFLSNEIKNEHGILYTFNESGIIHITNAHLLDLKTQKLLLNFLKTGLFCLYKSEEQIKSNTTIIFSSEYNLKEKVKDGSFSKELYEYLKEGMITLPNLLTLPLTELKEIVEQIQKNLVITLKLYRFFGFSKAEFEKLDTNRQTSYHYLKKLIETMTKEQIQKYSFINETKQISEKQSPDQIILETTCFNKKTLKDRKLMETLWYKFKNQSKIAQLLDVDRSSVHRRLKEYGIGNKELTV